jgi:hypothetical protein
VTDLGFHLEKRRTSEKSFMSSGRMNRPGKIEKHRWQREQRLQCDAVFLDTFRWSFVRAFAQNKSNSFYERNNSRGQFTHTIEFDNSDRHFEQRAHTNI